MASINAPTLSAPPNAKPFSRVVIEGVGLMGGSLGLALKSRGLARQIVGLGRNPSRLALAFTRGAIDAIETDPAAALAGADALILATPVERIRLRWAELAPFVEQGTFVTDLGSVKRGIVAAAEASLAPGVQFIGSHPMAGSEKNGVEHARADLYEGCACFITPTESTLTETQHRAHELWTALGARVVTIDPDAHDRLLAGISHLPHLLAAALMQTLGRSGVHPDALASLAGPGLRDTTRIAGSDPGLWREILSENAAEVLAMLDAQLSVLGEWRGALASIVLHRANQEGAAEKLEAFYREGRDAHRPLDRATQVTGDGLS